MTLAIDFFHDFHIPMFYTVEYQDTIAYSILPGTNGLYYPLKLKNKIIHMKYNKLKSTGEFYEWLRGFTTQARLGVFRNKS